MVSSPFDRETLLDLTVNAVPLGILIFFVVLFGAFNPFGFNSVISTLQFGIVIISAILLLVLTYYSGLAVQNAEHREAAEGEGHAADAADAADASEAEAADGGDEA
jgi:uncharacterized membrane protein